MIRVLSDLKKVPESGTIPGHMKEGKFGDNSGTVKTSEFRDNSGIMIWVFIKIDSQESRGLSLGMNIEQGPVPLELSNHTQS